MKKISDTVDRKFIESFDISEWEIETDTGWQSVSSIHKTIPYIIWRLETESGLILECADTHIVFDKDFNEIFVKDIIPNKTYIKTKYGDDLVISLTESDIEENMYDITVDSEDHRFYSNDILSHNTTTSVGYLLWMTLFTENYSIAITANKKALAVDILSRYQLAYENLPMWLQQGVVVWNKGSIELENGSKILAASTAASSIRGGSFNCVFMDEFAHVHNNLAEEFFTSTYPVISSGKSTKIIIVSCVSKDTYIFTDKGIKQVSDFILENNISNPNLGYKVDGYNILGMEKLNHGNVMVNSGNVPTKVITSESTTIECSLEHKLWACKNGITDWHKAGDLSENDYISISYGNNIWGNNDDISDYNDDLNIPKKLTKEWGYFLGLYLAKGYTDKIPINNYGITSENLSHFLKYLGFDLSKKEKVIPSRILECSKEIICEFLSGLFDGNGFITSRGKSRITSSSKTLIEQIRIILLNLGITSQYTKKVKVSTVYHKLEINHNIKNVLVIDGIQKDSEINNIKFEKIINIIDSQNDVYDFSLDHVENDPWCHSVVYNGIIGHQTPRGLNLYYKMWSDAINKRSDYFPVDIHWSRVPGRDEAWKEATIRNTSERQFAQEFSCDFLGSSNTLVEGSKLATLASKESIEEIHGMDIFEHPVKEAHDTENNKQITKDHLYVICADVSEGKNLDYTAFSVFDCSTMPYRQVATYRSNTIAPLLFPDVLKLCAEYYNKAYVLIEINNNPQVADCLYQDLEYENVFHVSSGNKHKQTITDSARATQNGINMSPLVKRTGCSTLKTLIETNKLQIVCSDTIYELSTFIVNKGSFAAEEGSNDDLVMTLVAFAWLTTQKYFIELSSSDIRKQLQIEHNYNTNDEIDLELPPSPMFINGFETNYIVEDGDAWLIVENENYYF